MASLATDQSKYRLLWEVELTIVGIKANMELVYSTPHSCCILIGQLKQKPSESCQKDASCHKLIKNFVQMATVQRTAL